MVSFRFNSTHSHTCSEVRTGSFWQVFFNCNFIDSVNDGQEVASHKTLEKLWTSAEKSWRIFHHQQVNEQKNQSKVLRPSIVRPFGVRDTADWFDWSDYSLLSFNLLLLPVWMSKNHVCEKVQRINRSTCWTLTHSLFVPDQNLTEKLHRHHFLLLLSSCVQPVQQIWLPAQSWLIDWLIFRFCVCSQRGGLFVIWPIVWSPSVVWQLHKGNIKPSFERCERILKVTCDPII